MKNFKYALRRPFYAVAAFALVLGVGVSALLPTAASAYGQVTARQVELGSSVPSATANYKVTFTPQAAATELVVDFCGDTPLIGANCSYSGATVPNVSSAAVVSVSAGATGVITAPTSRTINVTGLTMAGGGSTPYTIEFSGIVNPSTATSFYARILTYGTGKSSEYVAASSSGGTTTVGADVLDAGGAAMSTVQTIEITAKVMETLSMCTSAIDISGGNYGGVAGNKSCAAATTPNITIGHGSPTAIIDNSAVDITPAFFQLSTNATNGATVRMKSTNTCANGGLSTDGGTTCAAIPGNASTPTAIVAGTAGFGLYVNPSQITAGVATSSGTITPSATYNDGTHDATTNDYFAMETGGTGVTSTYGSVIASCAGPVSQSNSELQFGATASLTTPAGIYQTGESLIATGSF